MSPTTNTHRIRDDLNVGTPDHLRRCRRCGTTKPLDQFRKSKSSHYGRAAVCKKCTCEEARAGWHRRVKAAIEPETHAPAPAPVPSDLPRTLAEAILDALLEHVEAAVAQALTAPPRNPEQEDQITRLRAQVTELEEMQVGLLGRAKRAEATLEQITTLAKPKGGA